MWLQNNIPFLHDTGDWQAFPTIHFEVESSEFTSALLRDSYEDGYDDFRAPP